MIEKQLQSKSVNLKRCRLKIHTHLHKSGEPACDCLSSNYHGKKAGTKNYKLESCISVSITFYGGRIFEVIYYISGK